MTADVLPEPSFEEAVRELVRCSHWTRAQVLADVHSAYWQASAWLAKCQRTVEAGEQ